MASLIDKQQELQTLFLSFCDNVYYQPPESTKMKYPAIRYTRSDIRNTFATDNVYKQSHFYEVTVIDYDPDSVIVEKISKLPKARFNRHYTSDNLNHDVFTIYY